MMNTYELENSFQILSNMFESGEIDEQTYNDTLESLPVEECAEQLAKMRKNYDGAISSINQEISRLTERKNSLKRAKDRASESLSNLLDARGGRIRTVMFTMFKTQSSSVDIENIDRLPEQYIKTIKEPDKAAIKQALKDGQKIEGATLVNKESVTVR